MRKSRLRTTLIVANLIMLALPTYAVAGKGGEVAAGIALGCCAGMAGAAIASAADADHRPEREVHHVHHVVDEPSGRLIDRNEARAELAEAELWSQNNCVADRPQPPGVKVFVTFRGDNGKAHKVWFEPALEGETFNACMERAFGTARVAPFDLSKTTVAKSLGGG